jgi:hypothetical protein
MKRIVLSIFALLLTTFAWGQALSGSGTESNPYQITSADDWNVFATEANAATYWASGKCVRLDADITVSAMVGTSTNKYSGTFDGNWHTLTFNNGSLDNPCSVEKCAPFSYAAPGLTIKNLMVEGTIVSQKKFAAGLIGWVEGSGTYHITNCTSNITIDCSKIEQGASNKKYDCSTGGFIGQIESGNVHFENCIFEGLIGKGAQSSANRCAGFVSYINSGHIYYTNCAMAGTITLNNFISTFNRNNKNTFREAYYINDYGDVMNCTQATTAEPTTEIAKKYLRNDNNYFVPKAIVTGLETTTYSYTEGQPVTITPVVTYCGNSMTRGTDYIIKIDGNEVPTGDNPTLSASGDYALTIEGKTGSSYAGSQTTTIHVVSLIYSTWDALQERLAEASQDVKVITLSDNITPTLDTDVALEVNGTVVLNLNGKTIDRGLTEAIVKGQVIRVNSNASLTINGPGIIKGGYNKAENDTEHGVFNDGGGIYNMGTLVLNNVIVTHNTCVKMTENSSARTARGGGIYTGSGSSFTMTGGSISSNDGKGGGGGIHCDNAAVFEMDNVTIDWNYCESKGAGVRVNTSNNHTAYLRGCEVTGNFLTSDSESKGGGIYLGGGELFMENCIICGNSSNRQGAGFFSMNGTTTAINCEIYWNGTNFPDDDNLGGGICLYANQGNHSVYIMDGGSIYENNSIANGGGVYVYDGAVFQVKGNVQILNNYKASVETGASNNNTYLQGSSVIEVIEPLGDDAIIYIAPDGTSTTCVTFAAGVPTEGALSHFALDNDEYRLIPVDGHIEYYKLYLWNESSTWNGTIATDLNGELPTPSNSVTINRGVKIPSGYAASANTITLGDYGEIIIADGGQLIHNNAVTATLQKNISAYTVLANQGESKTNGWYTIASPVTGDLDKECVAIDEYDLYLYNEPTHYWWNAKDGSDHGFSNLSNGHGYLYANEKNVTLNFTGPMQATSANVSVPLSYTADNLKGYNLVGNPFTCNLTNNDAILVGESPLTTYPLTTYMYVANGNEMVTATLSDRPIQPGEGFFVQASGAEQNLVFHHEVSEPNKTAFIRIEAGDNSFMDRAYVQFGQGNTLHKMTINDDVPHLSIQQGRDDYASTTIKANHGTIPVSFKAATNGSYTITVSHEGMEMDYLHLIDNLTGADTDLLSEPSYTFTASNHDYASRFRLVYSSGDTTEESDNENFAFINDGQIILSGVIGDATVQLIDMNGRVVYCRDAVHTISTSGMTSGVYVLRLIQDDIVKTQKIVIG